MHFHFHVSQELQDADGQRGTRRAGNAHHDAFHDDLLECNRFYGVVFTTANTVPIAIDTEIEGRYLTDAFASDLSKHSASAYHLSHLSIGECDDRPRQGHACILG